MLDVRAEIRRPIEKATQVENEYEGGYAKQGRRESVESSKTKELLRLKI